MPSGTPTCVCPKLEKVDLPHLEADIEKYNKAGVFEETEYQWWLQFLESFKRIYGQLPDEVPTWPLDVIPKVGCLKATNAPQPTTQASNRIEQLHSAERENLPQVYVYTCMYMYMYPVGVHSRMGAPHLEIVRGCQNKV